MNRIRIVLLVGLLVSVWTVRGAAPAHESDFISLFNGRDLTNWDGKPGWWFVEDGAITAQSTPEKPCEKHNYLIWRGGQPADFDLRLEWKLVGGNSGIQFRSREVPDWDTRGYQADMDAADDWTGALFEHARGGIAMRGQKVVIDPDGTRHESLLGDPAKLRTHIHHEQWNTYRILARGPDIQLFINDVLMAHAIDRQEGQAARRGIIAFQMHPGPPMKVQFRNIRLKVLPAPVESSNPTNSDKSNSGNSGEKQTSVTPQWIWPTRSAGQNETVYFHKTFTVPTGLKSARLYGSCDDEFVAFLDGQKVLSGDLWMTPAAADVIESLAAGTGQTHLLAVQAKNREPGAAALLMRLDLEGATGARHSVVTDGTWRWSKQPGDDWKQAGFDDRTWKTPLVLGKLGDQPWTSLTTKKLLSAGKEKPPTATPVEHIKVADGFRIELLYSPPKSQGSWVSICVDDLGRLIVCDQYEGGLYRVTPPPLGGAPDQTKVEKIDVDLSSAQGLLWAFDSLYALVSKNGKYDSGLYRVRDTDGDDRLDKVEQLRALGGGGDHGWHGLLKGPDGKSIYVVAGDATELTKLSASRVPLVWGEDHLLPRVADARGFMVNVLAPGGCFYRVDPEGKKWELISVGYRNPYDAAFNRNGDLFTYDADMEWDMNTPWYRPTRVCLVSSGSEYGWRNGSGKWPPYYPDSLPPVVEIGPGSPVGMCFGYGAKFPAKYQNALFLPDWSYGRLYTLPLTPEGAAYRGEAELLLTGTPLPTTDILVNPRDGALYFVTGGWRIQTGLYRLTYTGKESTAPASVTVDPQAAEARALRRKLEAFHGRHDPLAVDTAWPYLKHPDRFVRFAARVAIESQNPQSWRSRALTETDPQTALSALLALVRVTGRDAQPQPPADAPPPDPKSRDDLLTALAHFDWDTLTADQRLQLLRIYGLTFIRLAPPDDAIRQRLIAEFAPHFPAEQIEANAMLCELLVYLQDPDVAGKALALVDRAPTQEEQIEYIKSLRMLRAGWTPELRRRYFEWFNKATSYRGGASFAGFIKLIKNDALATCSEAEKRELKPILEAVPVVKSPLQAMQAALVGHSFVKEWTVKDLAPVVERGLRDRDFARGRKLFGAVGCFACHRFANEGGAVGPDLTGAGGRYSPHDLIEAIIEPSKTISDLYAPMVITTVDDESVTGHIVYLGGDNIRVNTDLFDPAQDVTIDRKLIDSIKPATVSPMPTGLLDVLEQDEILDLMAYVLSGGDRTNGMFKPARTAKQTAGASANAHN